MCSYALRSVHVVGTQRQRITQSITFEAQRARLFFRTTGNDYTQVYHQLSSC